MGDAIISTVAERLTAVLEEQTRKEVDLVRCVEKKKISKVAAELNRVRVMLDNADRVNLVRGVEDKKISNLAAELNRVRDVLDDAHQRGIQDKSIKNWLKRLEDSSYELDDVLDEWSIAIIKFQMEVQMEQSDSSKAPPKHKVRPFIPYSSCLCFKKGATRPDLATKIKNVKTQLDVIFEEESQYSFLKNRLTGPSNRLERVTTSLVAIEEINGRDYDKDILVRMLIENSCSISQLGINLTSIVGMGGIGKTTLAQFIYNDSRVKDCFALRIWICVSDPFDEAKIAKGIVEQVQESTLSTNQMEMLLKSVTDTVSGKKFLLVLDDVWTGEDSKWGRLKNSLKYGAVGSSVLVTTRNERVAIMMGTTENKIHRLGPLSDENCWLIFRRIAFFRRNEENLEGLRDIGGKMAKKCMGLPLAAKVLAGLLRSKNTVEEWENVLNSEIWQLEEAKVDTFPHLVLGYNDLSPAQKRCFSYCAVFPKDHVINVDKLIRNWMALGYLSSGGNLESDLELRGREYFDNLVMRFLFQAFKRDNFTGQITEFKMFDIVHDFAQFLRESDYSRETSSCQLCDDPLFVSRIKEYRSLFCEEKQPPLHICDCLTSLRVLSLNGCRLQSVPTEIEKLIHLRELDLSENNLSEEHLKSICKIYNLQTLLLRYCKLEEIPTEIGNLVQLRHLDLTGNKLLKKLPEIICDLLKLRSLNVSHCNGLSELPQGIHNLVNLKGLYNEYTNCLYQYPQGLAQLTGLQELNEFFGGRDCSKLGYLKELNQLSRYLSLKIRLANLDQDVVEDAREAELVNKTHVKELRIEFLDQANEEEEPLCMDVLDALRPHTNLQELWISNFKGSKLPNWIASPHYQLREISMDLRYCLSLPPLGILPCLEEITIKGLYSLEFVGRDFLGITPSSVASSSSSTSMVIGFPKLKTLTLYICPNLKEWEDITVEEEESDTLSAMPCLTLLRVISCRDLTALPHRLLRKASLLEELVLTGSTPLRKCYKDNEEPFRKLLSHIPNVKVL